MLKFESYRLSLSLGWIGGLRISKSSVDQVASISHLQSQKLLSFAIFLELTCFLKHNVFSEQLFQLGYSMPIRPILGRVIRGERSRGLVSAAKIPSTILLGPFLVHVARENNV